MAYSCEDSNESSVSISSQGGLYCTELVINTDFRKKRRQTGTVWSLQMSSLNMYHPRRPAAKGREDRIWPLSVA